MPPAPPPPDTTWSARIARQRSFHTTTLIFQKLHTTCITRCTCSVCAGGGRGGPQSGTVKRCQGPLGRQREKKYREKWGWLEQWGVEKGMVVGGHGSGGVEVGLVEKEVGRGEATVREQREMGEEQEEEEEGRAKKRKRVDDEDQDQEGQQYTPQSNTFNSITTSNPKPQSKPNSKPNPPSTTTNLPPQSPPKRNLRARAHATTTKRTIKSTIKPEPNPPLPTIPPIKNKTTSPPPDWAFYRPPPRTKKTSKRPISLKKTYNKRKSLTTPTGELNLDKLIWLCNRAAAAAATKHRSNLVVELPERKRWLGRNLRIGMSGGGGKRG